MAKKTKKTSRSSESGGANVVRIRANTATTDKPAKVTKTTAETPVKETKASKKSGKNDKVKKTRSRSKAPRFLRAIGSYFKGAWVELRQVRWPNRSATWGMTAAVLAYSAFFVIFVLLLDAGFKYLFELILKK